MRSARKWMEMVLKDFWLPITGAIVIGFIATNNRFVLGISGLMMIVIVAVTTTIRSINRKDLSNLLLANCLVIFFTVGCINLLLYFIFPFR